MEEWRKGEGRKGEGKKGEVGRDRIKNNGHKMLRVLFYYFRPLTYSTAIEPKRKNHPIRWGNSLTGGQIVWPSQCLWRGRARIQPQIP